ncbi:MAG: pyruvate kinase [Planctomycetales bacterium]|nr:pyruvate kinase [Planctomycetales bacterium]
MASEIHPPSGRAFTKIVATVGPACSDQPTLEEMIRAGADVFRINTAHGSTADHTKVLETIRAASAALDTPVGVLVDLAGPKIRLTELPAPIQCNVGARFAFVRGESRGPDELGCTYETLVDELDVGDPVLLADGAVVMRVIEKQADRAVCEVTSAGIIKSKQGINLPGVKLKTPALTDVDRHFLTWAIEHDVDFVSLSFVRSPDDMVTLRGLLREGGSNAMTIAKIEKREALERIEEVVAASDAVMVARGDLGVEIEVAETPAAQKRIVRVCEELKKPVIVATQMLDSMQHSRRPTRAEATDVANAVLDGADACMLSGETAVGLYPVETVAMMNEIQRTSERLLIELRPPGNGPTDESVHPVTSAVIRGASLIARQISATLMVIVTRSGATARVRAKQRDMVPTLGVSLSHQTLRQMCLCWGIIPVSVTETEGPKLRAEVEQWALRDGLAKPGDQMVFITGSNLVKRAHNTIAVHSVQTED